MIPQLIAASAKLKIGLKKMKWSPPMNGKLCRFWVLAGCTLEERREPSEQRCAYARRCPAGVAAPLGCVIQRVRY